MLTLPYVTTLEFKAYPTFLDLLNLRSGDTLLADQDAQLYNMLLVASQWADNYVHMGDDGTLQAHQRVEFASCRMRPDGSIRYHPNHIPVTSLVGLSFGANPQTLTVAPVTTTWTQDRRQLMVWPQTINGVWSGQLQFGAPTASTDLFCQWTYIAGYVNTRLSQQASAGSMSIQVSDATGIAPGVVLRVWDPGLEEAVTVAGTYTAGSTTVPLTTGTQFTHTLTNGPLSVSALPADIHQAVIMYASALLLRPDTAAEDAFPDARVKPSTRDTDPRKDGSGLIAEAERLLQPYRRVR